VSRSSAKAAAQSIADAMPIMSRMVKDDAQQREPKPAIDLAEGRVITMRFGTVDYTWTFRRILRTDWEKFFRSFDTETVRIFGEETETFEVESGTIELARTAVVSVAGYQMADPPPMPWQAKLPLGHLRAFGIALRDVCISKSDAPMVLSELSEVSLDCVWNGDSRWTGLVHRFNAPTAVQQRKFERAAHTYRILGNDRGNRTIFPARQALMMDFYDELIVSVDEAYTASGEPLSDRAAIIREMDACHKVTAVQGLLNAGGNGVITHEAKEGDGAK
jgi:hypothetical protein